MRLARWLLGLGLPLVVGCADPDREWMKVNQSYTAEEFRRDLAACSRGGQLDEACMRTRGWVSVKPGKEGTAKPSETPSPRPTYRK
jgi:hypothetical protein